MPVDEVADLGREIRSLRGWLRVVVAVSLVLLGFNVALAMAVAELRHDRDRVIYYRAQYEAQKTALYRIEQDFNLTVNDLTSRVITMERSDE